MAIDFPSLWNFADPAASEARFVTLLAERGGSAADEQAEIMTQIARAQGLQRRFDEANATLDRAQTLLGSEPSVAAIRISLERGRVLNSSGNPVAAAPHFEAAWNLGRLLGNDPLAVDAAHMLAIALPGERGMEWNIRALQLAKSSPDAAAQRWAASLLNNIGWSLHGQRRYDEALDHFTRALAERERLNQPENIRIARWCIARCLRSLGRLDDALAAQMALADHHRPDGFVEEELGECLLALGRAAEAAPHFARAHELLKADAKFAADNAERLARLQSLAERC